MNSQFSVPAVVYGEIQESVNLYLANSSDHFTKSHLFISAGISLFISIDKYDSLNCLSVITITGCWYISDRFNAFQIKLYQFSKVSGYKTIGYVSPKLAFSAKSRSHCAVKVGVPVLGPSL